MLGYQKAKFNMSADLIGFNFGTLNPKPRARTMLRAGGFEKKDRKKCGSEKKTQLFRV